MNRLAWHVVIRCILIIFSVLCSINVINIYHYIKCIEKKVSMWNNIYIYIYIYIYTHIVHSKISKAQPEKTAIGEHFCCGDTLSLIKIEKSESVWFFFASITTKMFSYALLRGWGLELFEYSSYLCIYLYIGIGKWKKCFVFFSFLAFSLIDIPLCISIFYI